MNITKKTHFNPCFWTALWNKDYYDDFLNAAESKKNCRKEKVYFLEINSNKVLYSKTEDIFFENKLGLITHTSEELKKILLKYYSSGIDKIKEGDENEEFIWDFENHFSKMEKLPPYEVLMKIARSHRLESEEEKINLGLFLVIHSMRNHVIINSMLELGEKAKITKLEYFLNMRWMLMDQEFLFKLAYKIGNSKWTILKSKFWDFPLIDNPVISENGIIYCVISPRKILKVETEIQTNKIFYKSILSPFKIDQIKKRLISNTYKGIAFRTERQARKWKKSRYWNRRKSLMKDKQGFNKLVNANDRNEIWQMNQYHNRL